MGSIYKMNRGGIRRTGGRMLIALGLFFPRTGCGEEPAVPVVVLANRSNPDSMKLAEYYVQQRNIPVRHLIALDLPAGETISRAAYRDRILQPLREALVDRKLVHLYASLLDKLKGSPTFVPDQVSFKYLVTMYGVPLRIADTKSNLLHTVRAQLGKTSMRDEASVDSELSLLLYPEYPLAGPQQNPLYNRHYFQSPIGTNGYYLVTSRLDGPAPRHVKNMIDGALHGERYGLLGRAYVDTMGLHSDGNSIQGDYALIEAFHRMRREGLESTIDDKPEIWPLHFPMENMAVYLGWSAENISGVFDRKTLRFAPGAIAFHMYPLNAATLKSGSLGWAGPLIARGAAATLGNVADPYIDFMPQPNILADRLCRGYALGDSALFASRVLSWQSVVLGDPLYTPFKYPLEDQIKHLEEDQRKEVEWAYLRMVNHYIYNGQFNLGLDYCRKKIGETGSLVLREKLGDLYTINNLTQAAGREYEFILQQDGITPETGVRVGAKWAYLLRMTGAPEKAEQINNALRQSFSANPLLQWLSPESR